MRLFISIPLSKDIRRELAEIRKDFSKFPVKWVEEENLHITLVFLGETREEEAKKVAEEVAAASNGLGLISLATDGFSLLPNEREARILTVKLTGETEKLSTLTEKIKEGLRKRKINFDEKPFQPHITLGRLKRLNSGEKKKLKEKTRSYDLPELQFKAKRVELIESKLTPVGPVYSMRS